MEPLVSTFTRGTYVFTQVERQGDFAIYRQQHKEAPVIRYEVVRIRPQKAVTWPNGQTTPAKEVYPGSNAWGRDGFTVFTLAEAYDLLVTLRTTSARAEQVEAQDEGGSP